MRLILKLFLTLCFLCLLAAGVGAAVMVTLGVSQEVLVDRSVRELVRHARTWATGQATGAHFLSFPLAKLQQQIERPPPDLMLPTLGKGQQEKRPVRHMERAPIAIKNVAIAHFTVSEDLVKAMSNAQPGQVIELEPGTHRIQGSLRTGMAGTATHPITVRALQTGTVNLEFNTIQGFHVTQPFWRFENLNIRGICADDSQCEHAFHVVGSARGTVILNNHIEDFNAHIKVNGEKGQFPDDGLIQFNTFANSRPRNTTNPVALVDLVAASGWRVLDNLVRNFVKVGGNQTSYGIFMKGASSHGRIERNLIICTTQDISQPGSRVGISWGGGGTDTSSCRDTTCTAEHENGLAANNVVAHCNDAGLDVNSARNIRLVHNTLINTDGVVIRGVSSEVSVIGNLMDGSVRARGANTVVQIANASQGLRNSFPNADHLQFQPNTETAPSVPHQLDVDLDFCGTPRLALSIPGALSDPRTVCFGPELTR